MNLVAYVKVYNQLNHFIYHKGKIAYFFLYFKDLIKSLIINSSPRQSNEFEVHEMNAMVDDIERLLSKIAQQLKQVTIAIKYLIN
jgi:hypothetical protein